MSTTRLILALLCIFSPVFLHAQKKQASVAGKILDENENPLSRVNITILGRNTGISTSDSGTFSIKVPADKAFALVFTYTGYKTEQRNFLLNQGEEGACTGFGLACVVNYLNWRVALERGKGRERQQYGLRIRGGAEDPPHYGRPYAWHQQAAKMNFLEAWTKVDAPVLVIHGEYDQFEPRHGHELIVDTLNKLRPGSATFIEIPKADHGIDVYASPEDAYANRNPTVRHELLAQPIIDWAKRVTAR